MRQLKEQMDGAEFAMWARYRYWHGPMGLERRYDTPWAQVVLAQQRSIGNDRLTLRELMPWPRETEGDIETRQVLREFGIG